MKQGLQDREFHTIKEYIALERSSEIKHEYISGDIASMAGATRAHNLITGNVAQRVRNQLEGTPCETYANDMRVRTTPTDYTYPDVVVVCDEPQFEDAGLDTLLNPTVIIEMPSKTSEARDRGEKFSDYRTIQSVREIVFLSQHKPRVEHYVRQANDEWTLHDVTDPAGAITLGSIGCTLTLAEIYERVEFPPPRQLRSVTKDSQAEVE